MLFKSACFCTMSNKLEVIIPRNVLAPIGTQVFLWVALAHTHTHKWSHKISTTRPWIIRTICSICRGRLSLRTAAGLFQPGDQTVAPNVLLLVDVCTVWHVSPLRLWASSSHEAEESGRRCLNVPSASLQEAMLVTYLPKAVFMESLHWNNVITYTSGSWQRLSQVKCLSAIVVHKVLFTHIHIYKNSTIW